MLRLVASLGLRQELEIDGGTTETIFPLVEKMLMEEEDFQESLQYVSSRKNMNRYVSMMDYLFCEIYRDQQKACFRFYEGKGQPLRFLINEEQRNRYERGLIIALNEARNIFRAKRRADWSYYYEQVHIRIRKAA